jgi:putative transposase
MQAWKAFLDTECLYLYLTSIDSEEDLKAAINEYMCFYNHERFQAKLTNLSPIEFLAQAGWWSY